MNDISKEQFVDLVSSLGSGFSVEDDKENIRKEVEYIGWDTVREHVMAQPGTGLASKVKEYVLSGMYDRDYDSEYETRLVEADAVLMQRIKDADTNPENITEWEKYENEVMTYVADILNNL